MLLNRLFITLVLLSFLQGCSDATVQSVSVAEGWSQPLKKPITYQVKPGDTLYSIAWIYGLDYRQIAVRNNIPAPYGIHAGQKLILASTNVKLKTVAIKTAKSTLASKTNPTNPKKAVQTQASSSILWVWPVRGRILNNYAPNGLNKGLNISAKLGTRILAASGGKVVYAGHGLRGYGELIIIKHNEEFLSAYAHNQKILVQEGQVVRRGQAVALMGNTEARTVMLHFEIRKAGKPVDPNVYLPQRIACTSNGNSKDRS